MWSLKQNKQTKLEDTFLKAKELQKIKYDI